MTIQLPQRGQPIDFNYLYYIVDAINQLSSKVSTQSNQSSIYGNGSANTKNTSDVVVETGYLAVINAPQSVSTTKSYAKTYSFKSNFKFAPVVTATPIVINDGGSNHDAIIVIDSVTTSAVQFTVKFPNTATQNASIGVNLIAIGLPNS